MKYGAHWPGFLEIFYLGYELRPLSIFQIWGVKICSLPVGILEEVQLQVYLSYCLVLLFSGKLKMAPKFDFSNWWVKDTRRGTPVVVKMENPNYSVVEIDGPDAAFRPVEKSRGKNAKQLTWDLLLRANRAVGCVAWVGALFWALLGAIKHRLISRQEVPLASEKIVKGKLLFRVIKAFLLTSLVILAFELLAYFNGWHYFQNHPNLHIPRTSEIQGWLLLVYISWLSLRADYIAPLIQTLSNFCILLFLVQSVDRMVLCLGCLWIKYKKIKPRLESDPFSSDDAEGAGFQFPMVLVQIPMCNEKEVMDLSIFLPNLLNYYSIFNCSELNITFV